MPFPVDFARYAGPQQPATKTYQEILLPARSGSLSYTISVYTLDFRIFWLRKNIYSAYTTPCGLPAKTAYIPFPVDLTRYADV